MSTPHLSPYPSEELLPRYLADCRARVIEEIRRWLPADGRETGGIYELMMEYPLRPAKALRPALAVASCRLFGGSLDAVLPSAAALELYHNAFLVHDDVQDGSELRRGRPSLPHSVGVPLAVAVGDGMLALAMEPLLENLHHLGPAVANRIMAASIRMARIAAEGQGVELAWIRNGTWDLSDRDYLRMIYKKSAHYSFVTPLTVGALAARATDDSVVALQRFGALLGLAFQIQDDLLSLVGDTARHGKENVGDLWEGKRTLPLLHAIRVAAPAERAAAMEALRAPREERTGAQVVMLADLIERTGGVAYAQGVAQAHSRRAGRQLEALAEGLPPSAHLAVLRALVGYVVGRDR